MKKERILVKTVLLLGFFVSFVFLGMMCYRNNWVPKPKILEIKEYFNATFSPPKKNIDKIITAYRQGAPLFSDRNYYDSLGAPELKNCYIIQIPGHIHSAIKLKINKPVIFYRLLHDSNSVSIFKSWSLTDVDVLVQGDLSTHKFIISKTVNPGVISLQKGELMSVSPILFREITDINVDLSVSIINPFKKNLI
jgi:hypothetical protein